MLACMWTHFVALRVLATSLLALACVLSLNTPPAHALLSGSWTWPLAGSHHIIRNYEAPERFYAPGHRGIDLEAHAGQEVFSPADGVVHFVGHVVNRDLISIEHGSYLSTFEPVTAVVQEGEYVLRGQLIGTVASGEHCTCLHMGARKGHSYLSPVALLGAIEPAVLLPWD